MSTHTPLKCFIDSTMPGILRFADDPTAGLLAGIRAPAIMEALNSHDRLTAEVARLRELLTVAKCPECDGSGAVLRQHEYTYSACCGRALPNGECCGNPEPALGIEENLEPCQWCEEKRKALNPEEPK